MIPNYKEIIDLVKKGATIEAQEKIMELREATIELQQENIKLQQKVRQQGELIDKKLSMKFDSLFYYIEGEEFPYCPGCWGAKKRQTHLVVDKRSHGTSYKCPVADCKFEHFVKNASWNPPRQHIQKNAGFGF